MEAQLEEIREKQKENWNKFSAGWKKWDELTMDFIKPVGAEIIRQLNPKDDDIILDVAAGTGEPGLTMAAMMTNGKVVITDLSEEMLGVAREKAKKRGLDNVETAVCDAGDLPFDDNSFDGISCRFGFMFFPDMHHTAKELRRVLKPGGIIAVAVWGDPDKNYWVTSIMDTIKSRMDLPVPPKDAPGIFRCAEHGMMTRLFDKAGFKNISQNEIPCQLNCKTADTYWEMMTEVTPPVAAALKEADDDMRVKIKWEVYEKLNERYVDGEMAIDASALVITGEK